MPKKEDEKSPGLCLRQLRKERGLTMRDVEQASARIAKMRGNRKSIVPPSQLSLIEQRDSVPNIYRLAALARIYKVSLKRILSFYRV